MAKKSDIRRAAKAGLDSLVAMADSKDEATANRHLKEALESLIEASGLAPLGEGRKKLREAHRAGGTGRLLEAVGLDQDLNPLPRPAVKRHPEGSGLLDRMGLDADELR
jgi:hypothetical protein